MAKKRQITVEQLRFLVDGGMVVIKDLYEKDNITALLPHEARKLGKWLLEATEEK